MPDMLVKLYELPDIRPHLEKMRAQNIEIRRGLPPERHVALAWISQQFRESWVSEAALCFSQLPVTCYLAVEDKTLLGFACYEATARGFFGPTGVIESARGRGIGAALLLACLHAQYAAGYAYSIIGAAGPVEFYEKTVGAIPIPDSSPGIYRGMLRADKT
jgi:GNAT superfamily N-acetyltransferase